MKIFNFFRTLLCAGFTFLAVACYDDKPLWDELEEIKGDISKLETRIDSLEKKMAYNVDAIQSIVSVESIASWVYNEETGKGTITLVDGKVITIDQKTKGYSIITVEKGEDGQYYWAICRDGVNLPLMVDNKKVPVTVTPALEISEDNEWKISVDGGQTWINTGISYYAEDTSDSSGSTTDVVVFEKVETDGDYLILTLVGGTQVKVAIVGEAVFKASVETLWFSRGNIEKSVALEMNNVKAFTVTEKPEGWRVRSDESYIYVTSPKNFVDYPQEGNIKVFALFDNGADPEILQLNVAFEQMFVLRSIDGKAIVTLSENTGEDFTGYLLGACLEDEYTVDYAVEWMKTNHSSKTPYSGSKEYELADIIAGFDQEKDYVLFGAPFLPPTMVQEGKMEYTAADICKVNCIEKKSFWEYSSIKFESAYLETTMAVLEYYGGFMEAEVWDSRGLTDILETLKVGGLTLNTNVEYKGPANGFPDGNIDVQIIPATEYVAWYVPYSEDGTYEETDIVVKRFTSGAVKAASSVASPTAAIRDIKPSGFAADVTPASGAYKTYAMILKKVTFEELTDDEIVKLLVKDNHSSSYNEVNAVSRYAFYPNDDVYLVAVSINENGEYGSIFKQQVTLAALQYTDNLKVEVVGTPVYGLGDATLTLKYTGNPVSITYMAASYVYFGDETLEEMMALGLMGDAQTADIKTVGNQVTVSDLLINADCTFYAVVTDASGKASHLYKYEFVPQIGVDYVTKSNTAEYEYGMPVLTGSRSGTKYTLKVEKPATCQRYWLFYGYQDYVDADEYLATDKLISNGLESVGETVHTESVTLVYEELNMEKRIYMVWLDDKGRGHTVYILNPYK